MVRKLARDGMLVSVAALLVLAIFTHPAGETRWAIALGLACFACSVVSRPGISQSRSGSPAPRSSSQGRQAPRTRQVSQRKQYSPECIVGACGSCGGCDHGCGHPGKTRNRKKVTVPDDTGPDDDEEPQF